MVAFSRPMSQRRLVRLAEQIIPSATIARADYESSFSQSLKDPESFWASAAAEIDWIEPYKTLCDNSKEPFTKWFVGGKLNVCYNAVDRHAATRGDQVALIYDSPVTNTKEKFTYKQLLERVSKTAGAIVQLGAKSGDRAIIYMPNIPEAVDAMLACVRIGVCHSVVFGGFAAAELAVRIDDAKPTVALAASCGVDGTKIIDYMPLMDKAIELSQPEARPKKLLVKQRSVGPKADLVQGRDYDWDQMVAQAQPADCVPVDSNHPLYILYTSGSTGKPKGVLRDSGPSAVALKWSMEGFMRTKPGETYWASSDVGWVVGHSYIVYGPLLHGCSTVLFEGKPVGTPDAGTFWRVISEHKVVGFDTAPTALRAIRKEDPNLELVKQYDISSLKGLFVNGERCDPATGQAFSAAIGMDVVDNWWQTETGWPICGLQDDAIGMKPGSCGMPCPGYDLQILDDKGNELPRGQVGSLALKLPLPPACFPTLWEDDKRFISSYHEEFPGYYASGDAGLIDEDGYVQVLERTDDVINVAAHRLSTGNIEAVVKAMPGVSDAAVVGAADDFKGQVPLALVVFNADVNGKENDIMEQIKVAVRNEVGAIASLGGIAAVDQLPKTRSGKVLRKNIRGLADGKPVLIPGTCENPQALDLIEAVLKGMGYPKATAA